MTPLWNFEQRWRAELERVSLVAELELTKDEIASALRGVGRLWNGERSADRACYRVRSNYPASYVVAVAGAASMLIRGHKVWPEILEAAGVRQGQTISPKWGELFVDCLRRLELPWFPQLDQERALPYISRMLLHGGVPLDHLDEWFEVAERARTNLGDVQRNSLQAWLVERADAGRLHEATRPVERFARHGGDFAADFLDRSLDLLDRVRDGDSADDIHVGLARRYVDRAVELRDLAMLPHQTRRRPQKSTAPVRPEVRFDPYVLGVHLLLPAVTGVDGPVTWMIDLEGRVEQVHARPARPGLPTPEIEFPLPPTVASAEVARSGHVPVTVRVVDLDEPHLVFGEDGSRLERTATVNARPVWSIHPAARSVATPPLAEPHVVERHDTVARWEGWSAELIDLDGAASLQLDGQTRPFEVTNEQAPKLVDGDTLTGVRTDTGYQVARDWPVLRLPPAAKGAEWDVSVAALDGRSDAVRDHYEVGANGCDVALAGLAGSRLTWQPVRIRARGPLGRSLRRDLLVAPGLTLAVSPRVRAPRDDGLDPARVELSWETGAWSPFVLEADETERAVTQGDITLVVTPPMIATQHVGTTATGWRTQPLSLSAEEIVADAGNLVVRLPGASRVTLEVLDTGGRTVQHIPPDGRSRADGAVRFDLRRLTETARAHGALSLVSDSDVWRGVVARIRPGTLLDAVVATADRRMLEFYGVSSEAVRAGLYCHLAPTLPPVVVDVARGDSHLAVPGELVGAGPLRVHVRIDDPWAPAPWPDFPSQGPNTADVVDLPTDADRVAALHPLAPHLAGGQHPDTLGEHLEEAAALFEYAEELRVGVPGPTFIAQLHDALIADPRRSLIGAHDAHLAMRPLGRLLVDTGLVATLVSPPLDLERIEALWARYPAAGLLAAGLSATTEPMRTFLVSRCGPAAQALLDGKDSALVAMPKIDEPDLIRMDDAVLSMLRREAGIAPKRLLDEDSRADDGFVLIRALKAPEKENRLLDAIRFADGTVRYVSEHVLPHTTGLGAIARGLQARVQGEGWQLLPAASLAAAAAARLAPRASKADQLYSWQTQTCLRGLVETVPRLVAADLVMVEIAIQGAKTQ